MHTYAQAGRRSTRQKTEDKRPVRPPPTSLSASVSSTSAAVRASLKPYSGRARSVPQVIAQRGASEQARDRPPPGVVSPTRPRPTQPAARRRRGAQPPSAAGATDRLAQRAAASLAPAVPARQPSQSAAPRASRGYRRHGMAPRSVAARTARLCGTHELRTPPPPIDAAQRAGSGVSRPQASLTRCVEIRAARRRS